MQIQASAIPEAPRSLEQYRHDHGLDLGDADKQPAKVASNSSTSINGLDLNA